MEDIHIIKEMIHNIFGVVDKAVYKDCNDDNGLLNFIGSNYED